ncbi:hypothetical protein TRFO_37840 [Tritrichomonas foetus]|uniref:Dynein heavy chain family protein n=1 Tax=Tritrichomonas foetus TaxID=1144522 RepID=A0A1J4JCL4_9EUKA|nr:hypothetical protein TRFO_37840 [Tritrichomonas foetus]|eukprot:OHS95999.1 hypothetical protein TRFO_37840 [Tritrichomonas foetus]
MKKIPDSLTQKHTKGGPDTLKKKSKLTDDNIIDGFMSTIYGNKDPPDRSTRTSSKTTINKKSTLDGTNKKCIQTAAPFPVKIQSGPFSRNEEFDVSKSSSKKTPRLFIPATIKHQQSHTPGSARPTVKKPLSPHPPVDSRPKISFDKLSNFDDADFEDKYFMDNILKKLKKGPVPASSLYYTSSGETEWRPCSVISYNPPNFVIQWNITGQTKEVARISLRFDAENASRFEKRRQKAIKTRIEIDAEVRQEAYILARAESMNHAIDPEIVNETLNRLSPFERKSKLLTDLIIEVQQQYNHAFAVVDYINMWDDPEAVEDFEKHGMKRIEYSFNKPPIPVMPLKPSPIQFPHYKRLRELVYLTNDIRNDNFLENISPTVTTVSDFFQEFKFHFTTAASSARSIIYNQLQDQADDLLKPYSQESKKESLLTMINLRYKHALADLTMRALNHIVNSGLIFKVVSSNDPQIVDQPANTLIRSGCDFINEVYRTFIDESPLKIDPSSVEDSTLPLNVPELDRNKEEVLEKWKSLINENFGAYNKTISDINEMTEGIPRDLKKKLEEILPQDYFDVLRNGKKPVGDIKDINYTLIGESLKYARKGINEFLLNYSTMLSYPMFTFDISKFYQKIQELYHEFITSIFKYLTAHSDLQLIKISEMISSLDHQCSSPAKSIEEWYEKHTLLFHVVANAQSISEMLDQVSVLLSFLSEYLYEPDHGFVKLYDVKSQIFNVVKSLPKYQQQDISERSLFTNEHEKLKKELDIQLQAFQIKVHKFHNKDPTKNIQAVNNKLHLRKKTFDDLLKKVELYQSRDKALDVSVTKYPISQDIQHDFDIFIPVWNIALSLGEEIPKWLSTQYKELNIHEISDTLVKWETKLKDTVTDLGQSHSMIPMLEILIEQISQYIVHLQIARAFCNPNLRSRHWVSLSKLVNMELNPNDVITWHWMIESGMESYIIGINAISRTADMEFKVERTLSGMIEELRTLKLKVNEVDGVVRLEDPSYAVEMLTDHQRKMQEVFIPPYVNPFISKIKDYEVLSNNVKQILKHTLDAQARIDELKPAMDSQDLRVQHEDVCNEFDKQVAKFNDFTENFQLSLSFHQIVSNQKYVDISNDLLNEFNELKGNLSSILEEKRKAFPRFRLLSDSQLVRILSNCQTPSKISDLFNIMYPSISTVLFNSSNEFECIGLKSIYNEALKFKNKVQVTPEKVEKWFSVFDEEIKHSVRLSTQVLLSKRATNLEKMVKAHPVQITQLVNEIVFTSNITKCFSTFESTFSENKLAQLNEQFGIVLNALNSEIEFLTDVYKRNPCIQVSSSILTNLEHRDTVQKLMKDTVYTPENPIWYSKVKYISTTAPNFDVTVQIGPSSYPYGFEFGLARSPLPQTINNTIMNVNIMMGMGAKIPTVICSQIGVSTIDTILNFTTLVGKMPIVVKCSCSVDFEHLKKMMEIAQETNSFIIFHDLNNLNENSFNELSIEVLRRKESLSSQVRIFGTYSIVDECPERLKLAYRPILLNTSDAKEQFKLLLLSSGMKEVDSFASKLDTFTNNISLTFFPKINLIYPIQLVQRAIVNTNFAPCIGNDKKCQLELYKTLSMELKSKYGNYKEYSQLQKSVDILFDVKDSKDLVPGKVQNEKQKLFEEFLQFHFSSVLLGKPLSGKTKILNMTAQSLGYKPEYINQHSLDANSLFCGANAGLISSLLPDTEMIIFDGPLKNSELETIAINLAKPLFISFGDNTKVLLTEKHRFIFETDSIAQASPALLGNCPIFFLGDDFLSFEDRINFFLETLREDSRLIDQVSQTIVGSRISTKDIMKVIHDFTSFFFPKIEVSPNSPITPRHCLASYFTYLKCSILSYYVTENININVKNSAQDLIEDIPNLALFALYWAFAACFDDDQRILFDQKLRTLSSSQYKMKFDSPIFDVYFDYRQRKWRKWIESGSELLPISRENGDIYRTMADISPHCLLTSLSVLLPALHITHTLLSEGCNVLICGTKSSTMNDLILAKPYVSDNFSPFSFRFPPGGSHKIVRKMLLSILPDPTSTQGFTIRKPLLSLFDFDPSSSASELMRFLIEHGYAHNDVSYVKDVVHGIRFVVSCENETVNQRLAHHMFMIRIPKPTEKIEKSALSHAISVLWNIPDNDSAISSELIKLFKETSKIYSFDIDHLFIVLQRVATVMNNQEPSFLCNAIAHESVAVFYNAYHESSILNSISNAVSNISKKLKYSYDNPNDIAGISLLSNLNSSLYRKVSSFDDVEEPGLPITISKNNNAGSSLKLTSSAKFDLTVTDAMKSFTKTQQFDALSLSRALSTPRTNVTICSPLPTLPAKLVTYACDIIKADLKQKRLNESLMKCFHDQFISGGIKKTHHVLFINDEELTKKERKLLPQLANSSNVFGLFSRGEKLKIMTELYANGSNPFDDDTCESMSGYNQLLSDFLTDCECHFHLCIATHDTGTYRSGNSIVYRPYYDEKHALNDLIESVKIDGLKSKIENLKEIEMFQHFPYLLKFPNMSHFVIGYKQRLEALRAKLNEKKNIVGQIAMIGEELSAFMKEKFEEMEKMKTELTALNAELEVSSKQTDEMNVFAQSETEKFEKETQELQKQEVEAEKLRKELQKKLQETKSILESASKEVRALSSRDVAIIKAMNHPPHGVVLVVCAMCIVLDQPIDTTKEEEEIWNNAKRVMNDASFLNKLISKALDSLTTPVLEKLKIIIADPNFDPKVIQRASSAAKSICSFIRSVVPYYEALDIYKERAKVVEENEVGLKLLREQHNKAMNDLARSKKDYLETQNRLNDLTKRKKMSEDQLFEHSQKIDSYQKIDDMMKPFFAQNKLEQASTEKLLNTLEDDCFHSQMLVDLLGPYTNDERNQIAKIFAPKAGRYTFLPFEDDPLVNKWQTLNYPVSLFTKENTLMLSPNSARWVAAVGLKNVPDSYTRQILGKNIVCSLSVLSPTFEDSFIFSIKRNQGIVIYDYNFNEPHPLVMRVFYSQMANGLVVFNNESFNVPENFIVYFNIDEIPVDIDPQPPVRFVDLSVDAHVTTEMIALRLYQLTNEKQIHEAAQIEHEMRKINDQLKNTESTIRTVLVESSTKIFADKNMQWEFTNIVRKRKELTAKARQLKQQHLWLFDDFPTLTLLAKNLNEFFAPFPQVSQLWQAFESEFEDVKRVSSETLFEHVQTRLIGVFCGSIPIIDRIKTCAAAFSLKLDGSDSVPQTNRFENRKILRSNSDDRFMCSPLIAYDESTIENDDKNAIRVSRSNENIVSEFGMLDSGFDKLITRLDELTNGEIRSMQISINFLKRTHARRPVIIHTEDASYQMVAFLHLFKVELTHINNLSSVVQTAAQSGNILVTLCSDLGHIEQLLAAISAVTSAGYLSPDFRLIAFVVDIKYMDLCCKSDLLRSKCYLLHIDAPIAVSTAFPSTIKSLSQTRYDLFSTKIALFDAAVIVTNHIARQGKAHSYYTFRTSLLCSKDSSTANTFDIGQFLLDFVYSADCELCNVSLNHIRERIANNRISKEYPLPKSLADRQILQSLESMPPIDDPLMLGFDEMDFDFFKAKLLETSAKGTFGGHHQNGKNAKTCEPLRKTGDKNVYLSFEKKLKDLAVPNFALDGQREKQFSTQPAVIDLSLLYQPLIMINKLVYDDVIKNGKFDRVISLREGGANDHSKLVFSGLFSQGANFDNKLGIFKRHSGYMRLPPIEFFITDKTNDLYPAQLFHNGKFLMTVFVKKDDKDTIVTIFSYANHE